MFAYVSFSLLQHFQSLKINLYDRIIFFTLCKSYISMCVVRASLGSHVEKPSSASQSLLTDGKVIFSRVLRFSPTFDERSLD